jgi:hypothetical protein
MWAGEGELGLGEVTLKKALRRARRELGDAHEETLAHMDTYAVFLAKVGRFGEAEPLFRDALRYRRETLGDTHPTTKAGRRRLSNLMFV